MDLQQVQEVDTAISVTPGGGATFEDFDNVKTTKEEIEKIETEKKSQKEFEKKKDFNKIQKDENKTDAKNPEKLEKKEEEEEKKEDKKEENKEEKEEENKEEKKEVKKIKAKNGEEELGLDPELEFQVKIDGKVENVKLKDIINGHSGRVAIDRRFSELNNQTKTFKADKTKFEEERSFVVSHLKDIRSKYVDAIEGKAHPFEALEHQLDIIGVDSHNYYNKMLEKLWPDFEFLYNANDDQREAFFTKKELEHLKRRGERENQFSSETKKKKELADKVESIRKQSGISEEDFVEVFNKIKEKTGEQPSPEQVADYHSRYNAAIKAQDAISKVDPELVNDDGIVRIVSDVLLEYPDFQQDQIEQILRDHFNIATETDKILNKKIESVAKKQDVVKSKPKYKLGFESFDDYEK